MLPIQVVIEGKNRLNATLLQASGQVTKFASALRSGLAASMPTLGGLEIDRALGAMSEAVIHAASAVVSSVPSYAALAEEIQNVSKSSGVGAVEVQGLREAMVAAGGTTAEADMMLRRFNTAIATQAPELAHYNVTARDTWTALKQLADGFEKTRDGAVKNADAVKLLGRSTAAGTALLDQGGKALQQFTDYLARVGATMSQEAIARFAALDSQLDRLHIQMRAVSLVLAEKLLPAFGAVVTWTSQMITNISALPKIFLVLVESMKVTANTMAQMFMLQGGGDAGIGKLKTLVLEMAAALVQGKKDADLFLSSLQALASAKPETLGDAGGLNPANWIPGSAGRNTDSLRGGGAMSSIGWVRGIGQAVTEVEPQFDEFGKRIQETIDMVQRGAASVASAISYSLTAAFVGIVMQAQSLRQALSSIFRAIVSEILAVIARLAITKFLGPLLKALGIALGGPIGGFIGAVGGGLATGMGARQSGGDTFVLQSIDMKDTLQSVLAPTGSFRRSNTRLREIAATG